MPTSNRRIFLVQVGAAGCALAAAGPGFAAEAKSTEKLTEQDPYARSMGFKLDTNNVDKAKYPRHTVEQTCAKCQLYSGKQGEDWGPCSFYGGRLVSPGGWCRNFKVKKATA